MKYILVCFVLFFLFVHISADAITIQIHQEIGSVFAMQSLTPEEKEFVKKHNIDVIYHSSEQILGPFPYQSGFAYYLNPETNLTNRRSRLSMQKLYLELFRFIPAHATVIISPFIFDPHVANKTVFGENLMKFYSPLIQARPDLKIISAVQDGVGCSQHPTYIGWGYKNRSVFSTTYWKFLELLKIHKEVCEALGIVPQVNIELFEYDAEKKDWIFADTERIYQQILFGRIGTSESRLGPCWSLNGMGTFYDNKKFLQEYKK